MPPKEKVDEVKTKRRSIKNYEIDLQQLEDIAKLHATNAEIALFFRCSASTLDNDPYYSIIVRARDETKQKLKKAALRRALEESSDQMLKFCLKNYCGWTENNQVIQVQEDLTNNGFTITVIPPRSRSENNDG
jgi:hypothetical protein